MSFSYLCVVKLYGILCITILFVFIAACADDKPARPKVVNPNGDSELALLMRDMFDDGMEIKEGLLRGKSLPVRCDYTAIHTATPTDPGQIDTSTFVPFAKAYEEAVEAYNKALGDKKAPAYMHMVNTCVQCHNSYCSGPLRRIQKLQFSEAEIEALRR